VDHPQEDEFALISMGAPSPLLRMAFPNEPPPYMEFLDMEHVREDELRTWKLKLRQFVTMLMYRKQKPIVLKCPSYGPRTILAEMFHAVHSYHNPYDLFSSTQRLWQVLDEAQTFQRPGRESERICVHRPRANVPGV
jgi:hypothetical protein